MSAYPPIATYQRTSPDVSNVPISDIGRWMLATNLGRPSKPKLAGSAQPRAIIGASMMPGWTEITLTFRPIRWVHPVESALAPGTSKPAPRYQSPKEEATCAKYFLAERLSACLA